MFNFKKCSRLSLIGLVALMASLFPTAEVASQTIRLSAQPSNQPKVVRGYVRGTVGLHNIVGERDRQQQRCMGYGSASPDHQLDLTQGLTTVSLQVRSRAKDTTLVIRGPNDAVYCADDSALGKDAGMTLQNLPPGLYQVWVGSFDMGGKFSYTLSIQ